MPEDDLYGGEMAVAAEGEMEPMVEEEAADVGTTAVLPKEILAGREFEVGDSVILRIISMGDDQVEVAYDFEGGEEEEAPEEGMHEMPDGSMMADAEMYS